MSRPRRTPAPPGRVEVICTGRSDPRHGRKHLITLQLARADDGTAEFLWRGKSPVTSYAHPDGAQTYEFGCGKCHRNPKFSGERLAQLVLAIAAVQGTWDTPVVVDISAVEKAI